MRWTGSSNAWLGVSAFSNRLLSVLALEAVSLLALDTKGGC